MGREDYSHWNEEADYMWWMEEGRFGSEPIEPDFDIDVVWDDED